MKAALIGVHQNTSMVYQLWLDYAQCALLALPSADGLSVNQLNRPSAFLPAQRMGLSNCRKTNSGIPTDSTLWKISFLSPALEAGKKKTQILVPNMRTGQAEGESGRRGASLSASSSWTWMMESREVVQSTPGEEGKMVPTTWRPA
nr:uncharacterized protein LOC129492657 [Symphalangus syndactylus]